MGGDPVLPRCVQSDLFHDRYFLPLIHYSDYCSVVWRRDRSLYWRPKSNDGVTITETQIRERLSILRAEHIAFTVDMEKSGSIATWARILWHLRNRYPFPRTAELCVDCNFQSSNKCCDTAISYAISADWLNY